MRAKGWMALAFAFGLAMGVALVARAATETQNGVRWSYRIVGKTAVLTGADPAEGELMIPSLLDYTYPVTSIERSAFYSCINLTSVTIPDSVTNIGSYAFGKCSSLMSVMIPDSVTSIGGHAFHDCRGLTSVTIGNSVTNIGDCVFYDCTNLTSVAIGNSVADIEGSAFSGCSGLVSFSVAAGNTRYTSIDGLLLSKDGTTLLHGINGGVTIPDGVTSIG